jgi:ERCC4-type nuclease
MIGNGTTGIGPRRAEQLLERFGSIGDVFAASIPALVEVDGIGPATAEVMHCLIHHRGMGTGVRTVRG